MRSEATTTAAGKLFRSLLGLSTPPRIAASDPSSNAAPIGPPTFEIEATATVSDVGAGAADAAGRPKLPTFEVIANTGTPMRVAGWRYPVVMDLAGLNVPSQQRPVRYGHDADTGVGHTTAVGVDRTTGHLTASGVISRDTPEAREIVASSKNGFPWQASIGASADETDFIDEGKSVVVNGKTLAGPLYVVRKSTLNEISIVDLGADQATAVSIAAKGGEGTMLGTGTIDAVAAERERIRGIRQLCGGRFPAVEAAAIDGGLSVDQARPLVADALAAERPTAPSIGSGRLATVLGPRDHLTAAALVMGGFVPTAAKRFGESAVAGIQRPNGWVELAALAARLEGREVGGMGRSEILASGFSTVNMPQALGLAVRTIALDVFIENSQNWRAIGRVVPVKDFRDNRAIRMHGSTRFEKVPADGQLTHASLTEDAFKVRAATYGRMITLSRQDLINDDLGLFNDVPRLLGAESARTVSDLVFAALIANQDPDGNAFFSLTNGNVIQNEALSVTSLGEAVAKLRTRTDSDGRVIGLRPAALVVPAALETTARAILFSEGLSRDLSLDQVPNGNPLYQSMALAVEPRLDVDSTNDWYVFATPRDGAVLVAFLDGLEGVQVESAPSEFNTLGLSWRAFMDVGVALGEYRAAVMGDASPTQT